MTTDGLSPTKYGYTFPVARELIEDGGAAALLQREIGIGLGIIQISDEERAEREQRRREHMERVRIYEAAVDVLADELAKVTDPLPRAILDLHRGVNYYCEACEGRGYEAESTLWPCPTVEIIAEAYSITIPEMSY